MSYFALTGTPGRAYPQSGDMPAALVPPIISVAIGWALRYILAGRT
jgi:hypothetical protein